MKILNKIKKYLMAFLLIYTGSIIYLIRKNQKKKLIKIIEKPIVNIMNEPSSNSETIYISNINIINEKYSRKLNNLLNNSIKHHKQ
jgi:hypothetical protein